MGSGLANVLTDVCSDVLLVALQSGCRSLSHDQLSCDHWILSLRCEVDRIQSLKPQHLAGTYFISTLYCLDTSELLQGYITAYIPELHKLYNAFARPLSILREGTGSRVWHGLCVHLRMSTTAFNCRVQRSRARPIIAFNVLQISASVYIDR